MTPPAWYAAWRASRFYGLTLALLGVAALVLALKALLVLMVLL